MGNSADHRRDGPGIRNGRVGSQRIKPPAFNSAGFKRGRHQVFVWGRPAADGSRPGPVNGHGHAGDCHGRGRRAGRYLREFPDCDPAGTPESCGTRIRLACRPDIVLNFDGFQRRFHFPAVIDRKLATGLELAAGSAEARPSASAFTKLVRPRPVCPCLLGACDAYRQDEVFPDGSCCSINVCWRPQAGRR